MDVGEKHQLLLLPLLLLLLLLLLPVLLLLLLLLLLRLNPSDKDSDEVLFFSIRTRTHLRVHSYTLALTHTLSHTCLHSHSIITFANTHSLTSTHTISFHLSSSSAHFWNKIRHLNHALIRKRGTSKDLNRFYKELLLIIYSAFLL